MSVGAASTGAVDLKARALAAIAEQRRADLRAAGRFARACRDGDVREIRQTVDFLNDHSSEGWRLAMRQVGRLPPVGEKVRRAFLTLWIEDKGLPLAVGHRATMARALHVLMPPIALDAPLTLYRGTTASERSRRAYGFSWSTRRETAERFAEQARVASGGAVLLETVAQAGTVHLRREDEGYYDEGEVVVDPYRLNRVRVLARLPQSDGIEA